MTNQRLPFGGSKSGTGTPLQCARGLAELAFGSVTHIDGVNRGRHLALLHTGTLELNLSDPAQRCFDDYELLELLGEGGMGVVYRARQISLDREVAIKLLSAGPWASRDFIARFEREAQNAARMQHPNIVAIHEVGSFEGLQFFSMQLVRGESLSAKLRRGETFTPRAAAALMRTIAEAVGYAHSLSVLHLDLKPANLLLDEAGTPYVADFGLARRLENALAAENDEVSGTPAYMAPEQAQVRAQKLTAATDVWGLGAILYELLTGHPPFRADTAQDTVKLVLEGRIRAPRRWRPLLPLDLQAIVLRCLNREPAARYPSARALADDLTRFVEGRPVQARPLNAPQKIWRWARREPKLACTALLAFGILVSGLVATTQQWRRAEASANIARDSLWATRAQTAQQALAGGDGFHGLRPLIANLAEMETAGRTGQAAIERQRIGTILANAPQLVDLLALPRGEAVSSIAISPDGRRFAIATIENMDDLVRRVRQYDLATLHEQWSVSTENRTFLSGGGDFGAPRGNLRYIVGGRFLLVSTQEQPVVPAPRTSDMIAIDARDGRILWPDKLPERQADIVYEDTLKLALVRFRSDKSLRWPDSAQFYEVDGWKPVGPRHTVATTLAADFWLPAHDGSAWLGTRDAVVFSLYDVPGLKPRWKLRLPQTSIVRAWGFSHGGRLLALGSVDGTVRLVDAASGRSIDLASGPAARVLRVEFSADDRTLAAVDENGQLWSWDVSTHASRSAPLRFLRGGSFVSLIRFAGDTLFGGSDYDSGDADVAYVTLAPHAPFNNAAVPGSARLHVASEFGVAFDVSASAHRVITTRGENIIAVWRLPPSPLLTAHAAPLQPLVQTFDGSRLVAVDGNTARVIDAATGAARSPALRHPEPVRFADLSPDGRSLVTIAGRTVRVIDAHTWRLRGAPIVLPQTPARIAFAQAAPVLVAATSSYEGGELRETVHRVDLVQGTLLGKPVSMSALQEFKIDAAGRHAFVVTWSRTRPTENLWIPLDGTAPACRVDIKDSWGDALVAERHAAWFAVPGTGSQLTLRHWDLDACRELSAEPVNLPGPAVFVSHGNELIAYRAGNEALIRFDAHGRRIAAVGDAIEDAMYEIALSADGERAAIATRNAVHLLDTRRGRRLSAPLAAPIAGDDAIAKLAFSPDGTRLVARTINGRWIFWKLPRVASSSADIARLTRALDPEPGESLSDADVEALRAQLHATAVAPRPELAVHAAPVVFAPAAGAGVDPRFVPLDLTPAINVPMVGRVWPEPFAGGDQPMLAPGIQRFLGVDYRVDGGVQLSGGGTSVALGPELRRSSVVAVPDIVARRVHALVFMHIPMNRGVPPRGFAWIVLIGVDGRETRLEIRTVRDVVTHFTGPKSLPASVRVAFFGMDSSSVRFGGAPTQPGSETFAVTLDVPPGIGPIRGLRFDVADGPMEAPLIYAATLERDDANTQ